MEADETPLDRAFNYLYQAFDELQSVMRELIERMPEEPRRTDDHSPISVR